jgi:hypothetical protein
MAKLVFVSYAREDSEKVAAVERRLRQLDYVVWLDTVLKGGQSWWDEVLAQIRSCDVFLAVVSPASLDSVACARERDYAAALGKPVLPVAIAPTGQAIPSELTRRQIVDYSVPGEDAAFRLFGALGTVPPAPPLPDPLPTPPDIPLSYLAALVDSANSPQPLTREQQLTMLGELETGLRAADQDERDGAWHVLDLLNARKDLYADAARVIDRLRSEYPRAPRQTPAGGRDEPAATDAPGLGPGGADGSAAPPAQAAPVQAAPQAQPPPPPEHQYPSFAGPGWSQQQQPGGPQFPPPPQWGPAPQLVTPVAPPSNNLVWGILTTVLCCLPLGIVSIVYASKVNGLWAAGQHNEAIEAANRARTWAVVAAVAGAVVVILWLAGTYSEY